jgi:hypothetical protein
MHRPTFRFPSALSVLAAALALGSCAQSNMANMAGIGGSSGRPKMVVVSDFVASSDVNAIDHGYSTRHEAKGGNFPILERRQRTLERINDEIVATIIATVHEAGFDARPGAEQGISFSDDAVLVTGKLRPPDKTKPSQLNQIGFGPGRGGVVADMTLFRMTGGGKRPLATFVVDGGRKGAPANAKFAASRNAAIAEALVAENAAPEKLSPDVEARARGLGRAVGDKIVAFAKEQGWMAQPEVTEAQPDEKPTKLPPERPDNKKKPASAEPDND